MDEFVGGKIPARLEHLANWVVHRIAWNHAIYVASSSDRQTLLREASKVVRDLGYWRREPMALGYMRGGVYHMNDNMSRIAVYLSVSGEVVVSHKWHGGIKQRNDYTQNP